MAAHAVPRWDRPRSGEYWAAAYTQPPPPAAPQYATPPYSSGSATSQHASASDRFTPAQQRPPSSTGAWRQPQQHGANPRPWSQSSVHSAGSGTSIPAAAAPGPSTPDSGGRKYAIADFRLGEVLGHGASGQVFSAYTSLPEFRGIPLAIKRIARSSIRTARAGRRVANEITIQSRLRHRALVRMYASFHDAEYIYMLMEACEGGTVFEYLQLRGGRVSEPEARGVVRSVVDGLMHLQQNRIMHRDLKPGNLLITADGDVKIGDFGLATMIQPPDAHPLPPHMLSGDADGSNKRNNHQTLCGTPNFIAPEIVVHQQYSTPVDMWSLGCLMVMLLTGKPPFETEDGAVEGTFKRAAAGVYQIPRELGLSADARDLIATLLQLHPEKRGKLEELVAHPWLDSSLPVTKLAPIGTVPSTSEPLVAGVPSLAEDQRSVSQRPPLRSSQSGSARPASALADPPRQQRSIPSIAPVPSNPHFNSATARYASADSLSARAPSHAHSSAVPPPSVTLLNTTGLRPTRLATRTAIMELRSSPSSQPGSPPEVMIQVLHDGSRLAVSSNGKHVMYTPVAGSPGSVYNDIAQLPRSVAKIYSLAVKFVAKVRATTRRITIYTDTGRASLMDDRRSLAAELHELSPGNPRASVQVQYIASDGLWRVKIEHPSRPNAPETIEWNPKHAPQGPPESVRAWIGHVQEAARELSRIDRDTPKGTVFPVVIDRRRRPEPPTQMPLPPSLAPFAQPSTAPMASQGGASRAPSRGASRISDSGFGTSTTTMAARGFLPGPPTSLPSTARHRRTSSHYSTGSRTSTVHASSPHSQVDGAAATITTSSVQAYVPGIGWSARSAQGTFVVYFFDGAYLRVDHNARVVEYAPPPRPTATAGAALGSGVLVRPTKYPLTPALPEEIRQRLLDYRRCISVVRGGAGSGPIDS